MNLLPIIFNKARKPWVLGRPLWGWLALLILLSPWLCYGLVSLGLFGPIPSTSELTHVRNNTAAEIYSADSVLLGKYYIENRTLSSVSRMSPWLAKALVATEDARFYHHHGVDYQAMLRVTIRSVLLRDERGGGGSTLSQQLVKNLYGRSHRWGPLSLPINKLREMVIARRLERVYTKAELIELYLNTVPFGGNVFGVEVASRQFFGKGAARIDALEAATLIGMLKANSFYHPVHEPGSAIRRRNVVLNLMQKMDYLDRNQRDSLSQLPLRTRFETENHHSGLAAYFREHLRLELEKALKKIKKPDGSSYNLYTDGLRIYTSIDSRLQQYAMQSVRSRMQSLQKEFDRHWEGRKLLSEATLIRLMRKTPRYARLQKKGWPEELIFKEFGKERKMTVFSYEGERQLTMSPADSIAYYYRLLNAGFLAAEPTTGWVRAWVGGIDHHFFQYDHVLSRRQPGSTFKPVVYAAGLQSGMSPCSYFPNAAKTYEAYDNWTPRNADGIYEGAYSMAGALSQSINTVSVQVAMKTGLEQVRRLARRLGIQSNIPEVPSIALGTAECSLYEMVQAYATFANQGVFQPLQYLVKVEDDRGRVIIDNRRSTGGLRRVLEEEEAQLITRMLQQVVDNGTAQRLRFQYDWSDDIAGKTGTTQSHSDGWFIGYTPNLAFGAWVGGTYRDVRFRNLRLGQGAHTALPICGTFLQEVKKDPDFRQWRGQAFLPLSDSLQLATNCDPWLEVHPDSSYSIWQVSDVDDILHLFKNKNNRSRKRKDRKFRIRLWPGEKEL